MNSQLQAPSEVQTCLPACQPEGLDKNMIRPVSTVPCGRLHTPASGRGQGRSNQWRSVVNTGPVEKGTCRARVSVRLVLARVPAEIHATTARAALTNSLPSSKPRALFQDPHTLASSKQACFGCLAGEEARQRAPSRKGVRVQREATPSFTAAARTLPNRRLRAPRHSLASSHPSGPNLDTPDPRPKSFNHPFMRFGRLCFPKDARTCGLVGGPSPGPVRGWLGGGHERDPEFAAGPIGPN